MNEDVLQLINARTLPDDWQITVSRVAVQGLVALAIELEEAGEVSPVAKSRESVLNSLVKLLPDGVRTAMPTADAKRGIAMRYGVDLTTLGIAEHEPEPKP